MHLLCFIPYSERSMSSAQVDISNPRERLTSRKPLANSIFSSKENSRQLVPKRFLLTLRYVWISAKLKTSFSVKPCSSCPIAAILSINTSTVNESERSNGSKRQITRLLPIRPASCLNVSIRSATGGTFGSNPSAT